MPEEKIIDSIENDRVEVYKEKPGDWHTKFTIGIHQFPLESGDIDRLNALISLAQNQLSEAIYAEFKRLSHGNIKTCPKCRKQAIKWQTGAVLTTYPCRYQMIWKCKCGWTADAGMEIAETDEERFTKIWEKTNKEK
jgi:hypothetical protein